MKGRRLDDWLKSYVAFCDGQESPDIFHMWCGMSVVAATLERSIYVDRGFYTLYPNLYVVLVSGSAVARKSTAIGIATRLFREAWPEGTIVSQKVTPEALIGALSAGYAKRKISSGYIQADEMSVFLGDGTRDAGLIQLLTRLYDGSDFDYHTLSRGKEICANPSCNMLAGSAPEWLKTSLPAHAIGGGFTGRIIFVHHTGSGRRVAFPTITPAARQLRDSLITDLREIRELKGPVTLTGDAHDCFEDWYVNVYQPDKVESSLKPYFARKPDTVLKVAMALSVMCRNTLVIEEEDIELALNMLGENEKFLPDMMRSIQTTEVGAQNDKVLSVIRRKGRVSHADLLMATSYFANSKIVMEVIEGLLGSNEVKLEINDGKRYYLFQDKRKG